MTTQINSMSNANSNTGRRQPDQRIEKISENAGEHDQSESHTSSFKNKNKVVDPEEAVLRSLNVDQIKKIINYVRAMEESSMELSEQMSIILGQIEGLENKNLQLEE